MFRDLKRKKNIHYKLYLLYGGIILRIIFSVNHSYLQMNFQIAGKNLNFLNLQLYLKIKIFILINDKYLLQTKIEYNNDDKKQNILRERNILYLTH